MSFAFLVAMTMTSVVSFSAGCVMYVFRYRGATRWTSFGEYVRKGWPIFAPFNCLLYLFTRKHAAWPIMDMRDFPELTNIRENWEVIRDEALRLHEQRHIGHANDPKSAAYYDLGFRTFYKYGWSKFYLCWYGYRHASAQRLCPRTVEILATIPQVKGAMFSMLPAHSMLSRHADPIACSLRMHLGLATPNSNECFINVDGKEYSWRDGEAFLFDETYLHFVRNHTDKPRLILMCDVARPVSIVGRLVQFVYSGITRLTVVPNMEGDKQGFVNIVFSMASPILTSLKVLKTTNYARYLVIKYSINTILAIASISLVLVAVEVVAHVALWLIELSTA